MKDHEHKGRTQTDAKSVVAQRQDLIQDIEPEYTPETVSFNIMSRIS